MQAYISNRAKATLVEMINEVIQETDGLKETYEKLTDSQVDVLHVKLEDKVDEFFNNLEIMITEI